METMLDSLTTFAHWVGRNSLESSLLIGAFLIYLWYRKRRSDRLHYLKNVWKGAGQDVVVLHQKDSGAIKAVGVCCTNDCYCFWGINLSNWNAETKATSLSNPITESLAHLFASDGTTA